MLVFSGFRGGFTRGGGRRGWEGCLEVIGFTELEESGCNERGNLVDFIEFGQIF